jgi:hypothetical protein
VGQFEKYRYRPVWYWAVGGLLRITQWPVLDCALKPDDIDSLILAHTQPQWQKVAMIIAKVGQPTGIEYEIIAARINALVADGKPDSAGNIERWRHSEVRLKQP